MPNNRVYFAVIAAGLAPLGESTFTEIHGLQSCGMSTTFNLSDILELGQLEVYEIKEDVPDIEITLEKVLDGYPLVYHLATRGYPSNSFAGRQNQRSIFSMSIFGDTQDSASGVPVRELQASGVYWSNLSYNFPADGEFTESITLVGNNLAIKDSSFDFSGNIFDNTDEPLALTSGLGGVQRRQNFVWDTNEVTLDTNNQVAATDATILPPDIEGISSSGTNNKTNDAYGAHVSNISVSMDVSRESINELGRLGPYFRYATIPAEVTCEIEIISTAGHSVAASETAVSNVSNRSIRIYTQEGTFINLGTKNKLTSVTLGGGDTGGANQTVTYTYRNLNSLNVTHPQDPVV